MSKEKENAENTSVPDEKMNPVAEKAPSGKAVETQDPSEIIEELAKTVMNVDLPPSE